MGRATDDLALVEALAEVMAEIGGRSEEFLACRESFEIEDIKGHYGGYVVEARDLIRRLERRGYTVRQIDASMDLQYEHLGWPPDVIDELLSARESIALRSFCRTQHRCLESRAVLEDCQCMMEAVQKHGRR
jgi:hypothetical protein